MNCHKFVLALSVIAAIVGTCLGAQCDHGWVHGPKGSWTCYLFHISPKNWLEAEHFCKAQSAHLARVGSEEENTFLWHQIHDVLQVSHPFWLDGVDDVHEGHWMWASKIDEKITVTFWQLGEPNNASGDEDCMALNHGKWNDEACYNRHHFICEKN